MLILALHLALQISFMAGFNLVQVLVQGLLLQSLLKVTIHLEDVRRYYIQCIYINDKEKIKLFLIGSVSLSYFIRKK